MTSSDGLGLRPPLLFVLSGPSGAGKDSVLRELRRRLPDLCYAITATTRPRRPGEVDGKSYYFLTQAQYDHLLQADRLLAPANVHGYWYGVPIEEIERPFAAREDVMLKIDVQGALHLRQRIPQAIFMFLAPPSLDDLCRRLQDRDTESPAELERRIRDARVEMAHLPCYDYAVVNRERELDYAAESLACIVAAERLRTHHERIDLSND